VASKVLAAPGILAKAPATVTAKADKAANPWSIAAWVGFGLAIIGWSDVLLGMYPYRVGNPDWEFGALSAAFDSMPLGTIGLGAATAASLAAGRTVLLRVMSIFHALVVAFLLGALVLYSLSVPAVMKAVPDAMAGQLNIAIAKAFLLGLTYSCLYFVMFRAAWRGASAKHRAAV
jgi:hypothetical protein